VTLPPLPVAETWLISIPSLLAMCLTAGVDRDLEFAGPAEAMAAVLDY